MLNPLKSIVVLMKLLTEVLTLYDYVLCVLRSAILNWHPVVANSAYQLRETFLATPDVLEPAPSFPEGWGGLGGKVSVCRRSISSEQPDIK